MESWRSRLEELKEGDEKAREEESRGLVPEDERENGRRGFVELVRPYLEEVAKVFSGSRIEEDVFTDIQYCDISLVLDKDRLCLRSRNSGTKMDFNATGHIYINDEGKELVYVSSYYNEDHTPIFHLKDEDVKRAIELFISEHLENKRRADRKKDQNEPRRSESSYPVPPPIDIWLLC